jgi:regulator of protease activity HflC (stomatin/prohibitin superfamily)
MSILTITVTARECVLHYRHGRLVQVLRTGRHRRGLGSRYVRVDLRESLVAVAPQEVPTADGVSVKVTAAVRYSVDEPQVFVEQSADPVGLVYLATQVAIRAALSGLSLDELVARGAAVPSTDITAAVRLVATGVGIAVAEVVVKDVIVPAEVRHAAVELVTARRQGAAQLELARAETAALRSLANGARLLDSHPALAQLRLVQSAPAGTRLVLRVGAGPAPDTGVAEP